MALTYKQKVSFEVTLVVTSETEQGFAEELKNWAKEYVRDPFTLSPLKRHILITSLTYGVEAAIKECSKSGIRQLIKYEFHPRNNGEVNKLSPVQVC